MSDIFSVQLLKSVDLNNLLSHVKLNFVSSDFIMNNFHVSLYFIDQINKIIIISILINQPTGYTS